MAVVSWMVAYEVARVPTRPCSLKKFVIAAMTILATLAGRS
jgi:hypothetical protein